MRAISFGKLVVQNAGVPVKMGQSTLSASMTAADEALSVTSATPFCQDMIPFKMDIDPTGSLETVVVKGISGSTFTIQRGMEGDDRGRPRIWFGSRCEVSLRGVGHRSCGWADRQDVLGHQEHQR